MVIEVEHEFTQQEIREAVDRWENKVWETTQQLRFLWKTRKLKCWPNKTIRVEIQRLRVLREDLHYWRSLAD